MTVPNAHNGPGTRGDAGDADDVSLVRILNVFLRYRWLLVLLPVTLAVGIGLLSLALPRSYVAHASFRPQAEERSAPAGLGTLARQFGVNVRNESSANSPEFYSMLLRSRELLWKAATSEYDLGEGTGPERKGTLLHLTEANGLTEREARHQVVEELRKWISVRVVSETGMVELTVRARSGTLAEQIADRLIELVNVYNLETRASQARAERHFVEDRLRDAEAELAEAESDLQGFLRQNRTFRDSPELVFEHDRLQRQVALRQELVISLSHAREQARIDAVRDTPVITVVEAAAGSARPQARGTVTRAVLAWVTGLALAILLAFLLEFLRRVTQDDRAAYQEFNRLRRRAWAELRHPRSTLLRR
jgi:uncharacterized protein involved in exopolysaccharide biosynthesis